MLLATYYGPGFDGNTTASGETFYAQGHTAAHPSLPFGTKLTVCHEGCTDVRVTDRGPFAGADLDLSEGAAEDIGLKDEGKAEVSVAEHEEKAPVGELPMTGGTS